MPSKATSRTRICLPNSNSSTLISNVALKAFGADFTVNLRKRGNNFPPALTPLETPTNFTGKSTVTFLSPINSKKSI